MLCACSFPLLLLVAPLVVVVDDNVVALDAGVVVSAALMVRGCIVIEMKIEMKDCIKIA